MRIRSVLKHSTMAVLEGALIAMLVVGLMAGTAFAARGGGGGKPSGGGTLSEPGMVVDANGNGSPNRGDDITFTVSTTATDSPMVGLRCWQGTDFVYDGYVGYFASTATYDYFELASNYWVAGTDASCTARLFYSDNRGREHVLATRTFGVAP